MAFFVAFFHWNFIKKEMFRVEILFKCKKCSKKNNISNLNGTCGNCDNNRLENFKIIITRGKLRGMSGMQTLSRAKEILKSALNKEKILLIDPKSNFNKI
ncbi:hypothetical protein [Bacillus toyonensis]|uniref:hypothetical protein n=1 Tax=Bacillus toyonensis TaxID=155322 RepID=UPI00207A7480|nr:hypothetical protein [Bacillus toyonensis]MCU5395773.1 hypothetical protein [Bacillus toyonensis]